MGASGVLPVVLAAPPEGVTTSTVAISATVLVAIGAFVMWRSSGKDWPTAIIFTCFGVLMAGTWVGDLCWMLVGLGSQLISELFTFLDQFLSQQA